MVAWGGVKAAGVMGDGLATALLDATRYGVMMLRFAKEVRDGKFKRRRAGGGEGCGI